MKLRCFLLVFLIVKCFAISTAQVVDLYVCPDTVVETINPSIVVVALFNNGCGGVESYDYKIIGKTIKVNLRYKKIEPGTICTDNIHEEKVKIRIAKLHRETYTVIVNNKDTMRFKVYSPSSVYKLDTTQCYSPRGKNFVYTISEKMPKFPGGEKALSEFLKNEIQYPAEEKAKGICGTVYVGFIIDEQGNVIEVKVLKGISEGERLNNEAVRIIKSMPRWTPGVDMGKVVRVRYNIPVHFKLPISDNKSKKIDK